MSLRFCRSFSRFCRLCSISFRTFSLNGKSFGTPGSFLSFDRFCGFALASLRDFLFAFVIAFSTLALCFAVDLADVFSSTLSLQRRGEYYSASSWLLVPEIKLQQIFCEQK